ncbi:hypothetical protein HDU96_002808 [Phlyctochytrium bullatum]|nr:hypothetical protein HDU96_002808 [Phlyctochytrium bullatum]
MKSTKWFMLLTTSNYSRSDMNEYGLKAGDFPTASDAAEALRNYTRIALAMLMDTRYAMRKPPPLASQVDLADVIAIYAEATACAIADIATKPGTTATAATASATTVLTRLDRPPPRLYVFNPDDVLASVLEDQAAERARAAANVSAPHPSCSEHAAPRVKRKASEGP